MTARSDLHRGGWLFPARKRDFAGKRWVKIGLRTLHLIGLAGLGGAYLYAAPFAACYPYLLLTLASGGAMLAVELWSHGIWLLQLRGLAILVKLALLGSGALLPPTFDPPLVIAVLLISGIIAHAPGRVRYYSPFYGRPITPDTWHWGG